MSITSVVNDLVTSVSVINALKPLPPTISGYSVGGVDDTALDPAGGQTVLINGTGFLAGATITFDGSAVAVVTYVNPNQLTFTSPAKSAGTYTIYVVNADGGTAIYIPGIIYSVLPTWTTSAGTLGSYYETTSISNTVIASGDAPITYALYSGSLPTGSTLYANGVITGTAPVDSSSTTYSFTIQATDAQLQDSTRSFSLTINVDAVTWVSPANAATYTTAVDSVIANVALSATDAAGYAVSYSANALPTGLTLTGSNISGTPTVIADSSTLLTATAATTTRSAVRTINWSITVANDPYFEYNTLLIPGASTTFVDDASTNNFAVTIAGDTKPNSFNPYSPGYYSNYFDGTGDYISVPDNVAFTMAAGDFTIECWVNLSTISGSQIIIGTCDSGGSQGSMSFVLNVNSGTPRIGVGYGGTMYFATAASAITANTWVHIAGVRNGASVYIYVNGVQSTALNMASLAITDSTQIVAIGRNGAGNFEYVTGYVSNARIVKGTAVYTGAFTPPTLAPLTNAGSTSAAAYPSTINVDITFASSATSLLTSQSNRFIDNSTNAFTVTVAGNTSIKSFQPFTPNSSYSLYGSGYFDGTGDSIYSSVSAAGAGSFTYEAWVYPVAFASNKTIFRTDNGGALDISLLCNSTGQLLSYDNSGTLLASTTTTLQLNTWAYVALVRNGTAMQIYINGVESRTGGSGTFSNNITYTQLDIGGRSTNGDESWNGYITDARYTKSAVYTTTFTPPSAPLTAIANTSLLTLQNNQSVNNSVFLDNSTNNFLVTRNGNTTQGTFSPYGGNWSNYFDGSGDYLSVPGNSVFAFGTEDFTLEVWLYANSISTGTFDRICATSDYNGSGFDWSLNTSTSFLYVGGTAYSIGSITTNTWHHLVYTRSGSVIRGFKNGNLSSYTTGASQNVVSVTQLYIGTGYSGTALNGYLSNLRIIKGSIPVAYQTSSTTTGTQIFTSPTSPVTDISGTSLLTCQSNRLIDNSTNNFAITKVGDTSVQRFSPFNPSIVTPTSYSGYFDGTGDYLNTPSNAAFGFGTGDFTIEAWYYFTGTIGTYQRPWWFGDDNDNIEINGSVLRVGGASQGTLITGGTTILANTWYHVALTRASGSYKLWLNGTQQGSTASNSYNSSARTFTIMATSGGSNPSTGYVSNLRIVKGVAVYTGAFTVPTSPLTATQSSGTNIAAITGTSTSLLTCQSTTFIDNSTNNFTISAFGNSQPTQQNPFGYTSATTNGYTASTIGGSGYFDGTGDFLQLLSAGTSFNMGTGAFTAEAWIYPLVSDTWQGGISTIGTFGTGFGFNITNTNKIRFTIGDSGSGTDLDSTASVLKNTWTHIAITRNSSGTMSVFINGGLQGTATSSANITNTECILGRGYLNLDLNLLNGYMTDVRVIKGTSLYTSNFVPPSAPLTAIQNTTLLTNMTGAGIYDAAMMNNMETVGDAKLSTAISKFGGSSMSFDGTGDYVIEPTNVNFGYGTGDFTIEFWLYLNTLGLQTIFSNLTADASVNPHIYYNSGLLYFTNSANRITGSTLSTATWYHIAVCRASGSTKMFINGTQSGSTYADTNNYGTTAPLGIGTYWRSGTPATTETFNGYLDDLRITKGYARYTSNFTPPAAAFPIY
jgi:hypothetical protein